MSAEMKTKILPISACDEAISHLFEGGVIALPTETVYGLAARFDKPDAVKKIFSIKQRPSDNPLIVHISSLSMLTRLAVDISPLFFQLAEAFFPGPLTIILPKAPFVPSIITAGSNTIAVRMPSHLGAKKIIEKVGIPIAAPSANLSGKPSPTTAKDVEEDLNHLIPYIIDGGECEHGIESTVVDLSGREPALLRPGAITRASIEKVLQRPVSSISNAPSPGTKYRHYSPNARIRLCYTQEDWIKLYASPEDKIFLHQKGEGLFFNEKNLYSLFREADRKACKEIVVFCSDEVCANEALFNRLQKAASL